MTVLVSGANGFIGVNVVAALVKAGHSVAALVSARGLGWRVGAFDGLGDTIAVYEVDVTDIAAVRGVMESVRPATVVHLASHRADGTEGERLAAVRTNVLGTAHMLAAIKALPVRRMVHVSTLLEFASQPHPIGDSAAIEPRGWYAVTKAAGSALCAQAVELDGAPVVVLRLSAVYGSWQTPARLVPTLLSAARSGGEVCLTETGHGRDWIHVDDVAAAVIAALDVDVADGEAVNIGSGTLTTNDEVARTVERVTGRTLLLAPGAFPARPWDNETRLVDLGPAASRLGWAPRVDLATGLARTDAWLMTGA